MDASITLAVEALIGRLEDEGEDVRGRAYSPILVILEGSMPAPAAVSHPPPGEPAVSGPWSRLQ